MSWYEDIVVGARIELGAHLFTAEDVIRFAEAYDPQPFHTDPEAAERSHFGRLCASGWHTAAVWMKLMAGFIREDAEKARREGRETGRFGPSPGFESLKWLKPVYAGDTIRFRTTVTAKHGLPNRREWGLVRLFNEGFNEAEQQVFSFIGQVLVERRVPGEGD